MVKGFKILIEQNERLKLIDKREYNRLIKGSHPFKLIGNVNTDMTNKLNQRQIEMLKISVQNNINYLANKSPVTFIANFNSTVIKEIKY